MTIVYRHRWELRTAQLRVLAARHTADVDGVEEYEWARRDGWQPCDAYWIALSHVRPHPERSTA